MGQSVPTSFCAPCGFYSEVQVPSLWLAMTVTPQKGLPWLSLLPHPCLQWDVVGWLFTVLGLNLHLQKVIFFHILLPSTFQVRTYLSTFYSSFKTLVSHRSKTTGLVIRSGNCNPEFFLGKTPAELIGFSGRLVRVGRAGFGLSETINSSLEVSSSEAHSCDNISSCFLP